MMNDVIEKKNGKIIRCKTDMKELKEYEKLKSVFI